MYRKLLAVALALALVGMAGGGVMAQDGGGGATVADYDVQDDVSTSGELAPDGAGSCSIAPSGELAPDGGGC